jgi:hypothetical protein
MKKNLKNIIIAIFTALILSSCGLFEGAEKSSGNNDKSVISIVIEDNLHLSLSQNIYETFYGDSLTISLTPAEGYRITGCDYKDYDLKRTSDDYELTLNNIRYSSVVTIETAQNDVMIIYDLNPPSETADRSVITEYPASTHIKYNTAPYSSEYFIPGYTLIGWNTSPDGSGKSVCLGGRIDKKSLSASATLYARWKKWTEPAFFTYEERNGFITITGFNSDSLDLISDKELIIPGEIEGKKVTSIADNAFRDMPKDIESVILSPELKTVGGAAFSGCSLEKLIIYDNLESISDYSFENCNELRTLRINAATAPVYCGSYYATFPDKTDYLESLFTDYPDKRRLVLFSGSSSRFGYDSPMLESAYPEMKVANMGVFAYTNAMPQLDIISNFMKEGDILLYSPEFDASRRQFCVLNKFDDKFFNMIEENYSLMEMLDLRDYSGTFSAFNEYQSIRRGMEKKSYDLSPVDFDEHLNPVSEKSYNAQGDYCLYRPNARDDDPIFDLPVDYVVSAFPQSYIDAINSQALKFTGRGISFLFTYAPRNERALSDQSTPAMRKELDTYFREKLNFPVISDIEESLYPGRYLFETDNHLSTEGVAIRTQRIIKDLKGR